jgi:hypothetical protein
MKAAKDAIRAAVKLEAAKAVTRSALNKLNKSCSDFYEEWKMHNLVYIMPRQPSFRGGFSDLGLRDEE